MTDITLAGCEPRTLLSHMALYGLGAILESEGVHDVRLGWTESANPRPRISAAEVDNITMATLVGSHARTHDAGSSWVHRDVILKVKSGTTLKETSRALMSPRLSPFNDHGTWKLVQQSRQEALEMLTSEEHWLDLRFLASLGEPCYWSNDKDGKVQQDDGASRFEMQPRNTGAEFVGTRLRKLVSAVTSRNSQQILAGLSGDSVVDESEGNKPDSFTATGLAALGPMDNALAWCALWGISQFPIAMRVNSTAKTSGHIRHRRKEWFYVPMWQGLWRPARLRSVLVSRPLRLFATTGLGLDGYTDVDVSAARSWLAARGVQGMMRFPIQNFGNGHAAQRRAMRGEPISVRGTA